MIVFGLNTWCMGLQGQLTMYSSSVSTHVPKSIISESKSGHRGEHTTRWAKSMSEILSERGSIPKNSGGSQSPTTKI
jgi:hypothetical protein